MKQVIILVLACVMFGFTAEAQRTPREEISIIVVKAPEKPRHPYQDEYEQMLYPTVRITAGFSTGSGVIIPLNPPLTKGETGGFYILTAAHVVGDESEVTIEFYPEFFTSCLRASVVVTDTAKDLALLRPSGLDRPSYSSGRTFYTAQLAPGNYTPYLFTPVWAVGCSLGLSPRPSQGIISAINLRAEGLCQSVSHIEITAPVLPGNSGGPVYSAVGGSASGGDAYYQVIGIAVWVKVYQGQLVTTMAGVVPITEIYNFLEDHFPAKAGSNSLITPLRANSE